MAVPSGAATSGEGSNHNKDKDCHKEACGEGNAEPSANEAQGNLLERDVDEDSVRTAAALSYAAWMHAYQGQSPLPAAPLIARNAFQNPQRTSYKEY